MPSPTADETILRTLLYADVFDYPLTPAEIHHYLIGDTVTPEQVDSALTSSAWLAPRITRSNGYIAARDREGLSSLRDQRARESARLWPVARRWGRWMGSLPFVRMVAVTGALAMNNAPAEDDIDFLIVTTPGRVWLARAGCIVLVRVARLFGVGLCPNYVLSQSALEQTHRDLYVAHDLLQMVPLVGFDVYAALRAANRWAEVILPHARRPLHDEPEQRPGPLGRALRRLGEWLLGGPWGERLEAWERRRKIRRFAAAAQAPGANALLDADHVKGHFNDHGQAVLQAFEERVRRYCR